MSDLPGKDGTGSTDKSAESPDRAAEKDLQHSLRTLSELATSQLDLEETMTRIAQLAVSAIPGADGAGLTLLEKDRPDTLAATGSFVREVDAIQYGIGQGPCITAAAERQTQRSGSLGGDQRWPQFGSKVARLNVHSVLSLALATAEGVVGSINVYAHPKQAFDKAAADVGEAFAVPAAVALQNAQVLAQTKRLAAQLQTALASRAVIDQAIGILMSRGGVSANEAFARLRTLSQHQHQRLHAVAQSVVDQAVRRARALHHKDE